jgi:hypothetical protein
MFPVGSNILTRHYNSLSHSLDLRFCSILSTHIDNYVLLLAQNCTHNEQPLEISFAEMLDTFPTIVKARTSHSTTLLIAALNSIIRLAARCSLRSTERHSIQHKLYPYALESFSLPFQCGIACFFDLLSLIISCEVKSKL